MMLEQILKETAIKKDMQAKTKEEAIEELVDLLCDTYSLKNKEEIVESITKREQLGSTGMGHGIAIPHCKLENLDEIHLAIGISPEGIDYKALDGEPVNIFFVLIAPASEAGPHLKALARISRLLRDEYFCRSLINAEKPENIYKIVISDDAKN